MAGNADLEGPVLEDVRTSCRTESNSTTLVPSPDASPISEQAFEKQWGLPTKQDAQVRPEKSTTALKSLICGIRRGTRWLFNLRMPVPPDDTEALPELRVRSLDEFKIPNEGGYPRLATFQDSDAAFMVYRRFGYISTRLLLNKQDELRRLEDQLDEYDGANAIDAFTTSLEGKAAQSRKSILDRLETAYAAYASILINAQQLMTFNTPSNAEHGSVFNYLEARKPIHKDERTYILHRQDLVTLRPGREHAWLDRMIESSLRRLHKKLPFLNRWFCTEETRKKCTNDDVIYTTPERVNHCATIIITIMILALLIVPIYVLYKLVADTDGTFGSRTTANCIGTLLVFTLAFSATLSIFTRAKRHEILGAAAGYCAVLVVFLGNVPN